MPEEASGYFKAGVNTGAQLLALEIAALVEKYDGRVDAWDDVTGASLVGNLVQQARAIEMQFFSKMGVFGERLPKHVVKA